MREDNRWGCLQCFPICIMVVGIVVSLFCSINPVMGEERPFRLGGTVSLEGKYESLSFMVRNGYKLWAEEVNSRGGILGRKVELVFYDDKSRKELVGPLYERLITEDKVDAVLSPYGSTLTMAAAEVTDKHGYVLLAASASSLEIWSRGFRSVFGIYSTADRYFLGFLDLIAREGLKTVGVVYSNTTFNISAAEGVKKWCRLFGLEVVFSEGYDDYKHELTGIINKLYKQPHDSLVFCGYPPAGYHFLKVLEEKKIKPKGLAVTIIPALPDFYNTVGPFAEGVFGPSQWEADDRLPFPGTSKFIETFVETVGKRPSYQACSSYSACQILEKAVIHAGTFDHNKIRSFVTNLDTVTIMGRFKVDITGKQIGHNPIMVQWQKGKKEIVYPTKMRTAPAKFNGSSDK